MKRKKFIIFTIFLIIMQIVLLQLVGDRNYSMALSYNITDDMILIPSNPNFTFKVGINGNTKFDNITKKGRIVSSAVFNISCYPNDLIYAALS